MIAPAIAPEIAPEMAMLPNSFCERSRETLMVAARDLVSKVAERVGELFGVSVHCAPLAHRQRRQAQSGIRGHTEGLRRLLLWPDPLWRKREQIGEDELRHALQALRERETLRALGLKRCVTQHLEAREHSLAERYEAFRCVGEAVYRLPRKARWRVRGVGWDGGGYEG